MTMQAERSSRTSQQEIDVQVDALDSKSIKSIQLASGWEQVSECQITQFAVGTAHSPITPNKVFPTLRYRNRDGKQVYTPLSQVLSFSEEQISNL